METNFKYDPEDIESLLMHKQFNELFEEEKSFILQHVEGEDEYESLRKTLFELHDAALASDWLEPDPSIKMALMQEFAQEKKGGFRIWLNSLFAMPEVVWYRRPALQVAFASVIVLVAVVFFFNIKNDQWAAAENVPIKNSESTPAEIDAEGENLFADNLTVKEYPPSPKVASDQVAHINEVSADEAPSFAESEMKNVPSVVEEVYAADDAESALSEDLNLEELSSKKTSDALKDKYTEKEKAQEATGTATNFDQTTKSLEEAGPILTTKSVEVAPSANYTTSGNAITLSAVEATGQVYTWQIAPTNSIPMSDMKDLLSILYTAP